MGFDFGFMGKPKVVEENAFKCRLNSEEEAFNSEKVDFIYLFQFDHGLFCQRGR